MNEVQTASPSLLCCVFDYQSFSWLKPFPSRRFLLFAPSSVGLCVVTVNTSGVICYIYQCTIHRYYGTTEVYLSFHLSGLLPSLELLQTEIFGTMVCIYIW